MNTLDLIDNIRMGDAQMSNNTFNSLMADKMNVALDLKRTDVANSMYEVEATPIEEPASDTDV